MEVDNGSDQEILDLKPHKIAAYTHLILCKLGIYIFFKNFFREGRQCVDSFYPDHA